MHRIKRSGFSMNNEWLTALRLLQKGLEPTPSNSVSAVGFAGVSSLATGRSLISELSESEMMKSSYKREYSVGYSQTSTTKVVDNDEPGISGPFSLRLVPPTTHGRKLDENVPKQPVVENSVAPVSPIAAVDSKKLRALSRVTDSIPTEKLPTHIVYLIELGMDLEAIRKAIRRHPHFASCSLDRKIKPLVEFLVDLGIQKQQIPTILSREPQLCGMSLSDNLIPTMAFLEELGVDKKQWAKVIYRCPGLLTSGRQKMNTTVEFLCNMGLSAENVGKVLTRCPNIISCSIEENLIPTMVFLEELGVDKKQWAKVICQSPNLLTCSRQKLKTTVDFLYEMGLSTENVGKVLTRFANIVHCSIEEKLRPTAEYFRSLEVDVGVFLYRTPAIFGLSIETNLKPKCEFFLTMVYPKSELLKFPPYFSCSLEGRIKPRYEIVRKSGVKIGLNRMLSLSEHGFQELLQKKMKKKLSHLHVSVG